MYLLSPGENKPKINDEHFLLAEYAKNFSEAKNFTKGKRYSNGISKLEECLNYALKLQDSAKIIDILFYLSKCYFKTDSFGKCLQSASECRKYFFFNGCPIMRCTEELLSSSELLGKISSYIFFSLSILNNLNEMNDLVHSTIQSLQEENVGLVNKLTVFKTFIRGIFILPLGGNDRILSAFCDDIDISRNEIILSHKSTVDPKIKNSFKALFSMAHKYKLLVFLNGKFYQTKYKLQPNGNKIVSFLDKNIEMYLQDKNMLKIKSLLETFAKMNKTTISFEFQGTRTEELLQQWKNRIDSFEKVYILLKSSLDLIFQPCYTITIDSPIHGNTCNGMNKKTSSLPLIGKPLDNSSSMNLFLRNISTMTSKQRQMQMEPLLLEKSTSSNTTDNSPVKIDRGLIKSSVAMFSTRVVATSDVKVRLNAMKNTSIGNDWHGKKRTVKALCLNETVSENVYQMGSIIPSRIKVPKQSRHSNVVLNLNTTEKSYYTASFPHSPTKEHASKSVVPSPSSDFFASSRKSNSSLNIHSSPNAKIVTIMPGYPENYQIKTKYVPILRNYNHLLFKIILDSYTSPGKPPREQDLFEAKFPNFISNFFMDSHKGKSKHVTETKVNQDVCFAYENFLLIKNLFFFGVCDGHGKSGHVLSEHVKYSLPTNIQYLEMGKGIEKKDKDLNILISKLFQLTERANVKEISMMRYLYDKFVVNMNHSAFVKRSTKEISQTLLEAFDKTNRDLKERDIDYNTSGTTVCSVIISGDVLYCANLGDSRAVIGSFDENENSWKVKQLSKDHKPTDQYELRRIVKNNGRVDPSKDDEDLEVGPLRVWVKNDESLGLAMSRSIGDYLLSSIGVISEPEIYEYTLTACDKFAIIATDGIWECISNEKAVDIVSEIYIDKSKKSQDACNELISAASNFWTSKKKSMDDITCIVIFLDIRE